ncbi:MAG: tRNA (guanine(46)-N(7))-methyltransferase TrmB [Rickettsiales bacterium]|jgi:tRNA (guanine-N7-)-methyltransferase|nr:tRNA (guanine(46)-N(7))-methyltransferase TrmB [Rickettsiales bacterium]
MEAKNKTYFGRRQGRSMNDSKKEFLAQNLAPFAIQLPADGTIDFAKLFAHAPKKITFEIGYGYGEHLTRLAAAHPDEAFIGTEVFLDGNYSLLRELQNASIKNVRIFPDDANLLFPHLAPASFDRIFILYPDPWPKNRNEERRMVNARNLALFHKFLKPDGTLFVASDHPVYIPWTLMSLKDNPGLFEWTAHKSADFKNPPAGWTPTRYEEKAIAAGRSPTYLELRKI